MFDLVARANIHHQQAVKLLKQRDRVHTTFVYQQGRMATLEQNFIAHIYALLDAEEETLKPEVAAVVATFKMIIEQSFTVDRIAAVYQQNKRDETQSLALLCSLLPKLTLENKLSVTFEQADLEDLLYRQNQLFEVLQYFDIVWPSELLQVARKSALVGQFIPSLNIACLLFGQDNVTTLELAQGYCHAQFSLAIASFIKGLQVDKSNAQNALFNRFAKTSVVPEKALLLEVAGLSGDVRWAEPCLIFCKENPDLAFNVLCHFQDKAFLKTIIDLMNVAQTTDAAYKAWLLLTASELLKKPQFQDIDNKHNQAGEVNLPNDNQAELIRQHLMQQTGSKVLAGISFDESNAIQKLVGLQGRAVQRALLFSLKMNDGMSLYCRQLSSIAFIEKITAATHNSTAADKIDTDKADESKVYANKKSGAEYVA